MASAKGKFGKPVIKTDTSYKSPSIPELGKEKSEIVVGLLSSLLEPVGRHRAAYSVKSSGKKSKKRKRNPGTSQDQVPAVKPQPPQPEVLGHLTVGLNSTTRRLEYEASLSKPGAVAATEGDQNDGKHLAAIFLPKPKDDLIYSHLPMLCFTASAAYKGIASTRLVLLDPIHERTIAAAMGLPRAGVIGVMDGVPGSVSLMNYISDNVAPVEVPWLEDALAGKWMGVSIQTHIPGQT